MEPWTPEWRQARLEELQAQWSDCTRCALAKGRHCVVFGEGNPCADILLCGEGPGENEDEEGRPFVGESGQLLDAIIKETSISREELYVTNLVACRPLDSKGKNRSPIASEVAACRERLNQIIYLVDPLVVIAVGAEALAHLMRSRLPITQLRGKLLSPGARVQGVLFPRLDENKKQWDLTYDVYPVLHPSYLLRSDAFNEATQSFKPGGEAERTFWDFKQIFEHVQLVRAKYNLVKPRRT